MGIFDKIKDMLNEFREDRSDTAEAPRFTTEDYENWEKLRNLAMQFERAETPEDRVRIHDEINALNVPVELIKESGLTNRLESIHNIVQDINDARLESILNDGQSAEATDPIPDEDVVITKIPNSREDLEEVGEVVENAETPTMPETSPEELIEGEEPVEILEETPIEETAETLGSEEVLQRTPITDRLKDLRTQVAKPFTAMGNFAVNSAKTMGNFAANTASKATSAMGTAISDGIARAKQNAEFIRAREGAYKTEKSGILFQALDNSLNIVERIGYRQRTRKRIEAEVRGETTKDTKKSEDNIVRKIVNKVYSPKVRTASKDIGEVVARYADSWKSVDFEGKEIDLPKRLETIKNNLTKVFVVENGKLTSEIIPEVSQNLSSSQLQMLDKNISTIIEKLHLINNDKQIQNKNGYNIVKRYLDELDYATSKCQDIYSGAINSDKYLESQEKSIKQETLERDNFENQKKDIVLAFKQMGWEVNFKNNTATQLEPKVEIANVSPFEQSQVEQFIVNYNKLSDRDKKAFTIQGLFDVYVATAKKVALEDFKKDPEYAKEIVGNIDAQKGNFNVNSKEWQILSLSEGSEFEYNKQMMSLLFLSRDYGKSNVKASENVLKYKDVSAWDKLVATFPEENEVKTKIEEIRSKYINLIIDEVNASTNKVINKESAIYKAYSEIVKLEDENMPQIEIEDVISRQVYDVMSKSNNLPSGVISYSDWLKLNGVEIPETTTATTTENITASDVTYSKEDIVKILENDDNKAFVEQWMKDNDFDNNPELQKQLTARALSGLHGEDNANLFAEVSAMGARHWRMYSAIVGMLDEASENNSGKSIDELWQASIGEMEADNTSLIREAAESFNSPDYKMTSDLYKFGVFYNAVDAFIKKLDNLHIKDVAEKSKTFDQMCDIFREKDNILDPAYYQAMKECVMAGGCAGNAYYGDLVRKAEEDANIQKYDNLIQDMNKKLEEMNGATDLTDEEIAKNQDIKETIDRWNSACKSNDKAKMLGEVNQGLKDPIKGESALLTEFNNSKDKIKTSTLGDQVQFDAQGLAKKLKPFNVKAGQKYLQGLIDAIKKVVIMERESEDSKSSDKSGTGNNNGGTTNSQSEEEKQKELEIKEDAAFYLMGEAFNHSLNDNLQSFGIPSDELYSFKNGGQLSQNTLNKLSQHDLGPADVMSVINRQQSMHNLFDRMAFGQPSEQKWDFPNGKNTIKCDKNGYLKQVLYAKASNHNFVLDKDQLAIILIDGEEDSLGVDGKRTALDADNTYAQRIRQKRPDIAAIIDSLDSINNEEAFFLVGVVSTSDGKDGHFAGKVDEATLTKLKGAKTLEERRNILRGVNINTILNPRDIELNMALAESRAKFRGDEVKRITDKVKEALKNNPQMDKISQQNIVIQELNSDDFSVRMSRAGITEKGDLNATANGVMQDNQASMIHRIKNDCFVEIENGFEKEEQNVEQPTEVQVYQTPENPAPQEEVIKQPNPEVVEEQQTTPVEPNYDAIVDKLIENGFDLSVLNMQTADKFPEALKQQKRVKLRNEIGYLNVNDYKEFLSGTLTEEVLNTILDKFEAKIKENQVETQEVVEEQIEPIYVKNPLMRPEEEQFLNDRIKDLRKFEWVLKSIESSQGGLLSRNFKDAVVNNPEFREQIQKACDSQPKFDQVMPFTDKENGKIQAIIQNLLNSGVAQEDIVKRTIQVMKNPDMNDEMAVSVNNTLNQLIKKFDGSHICYYMTQEHIVKLANALTMKKENAPVKDYQKIVDALKSNGFSFDVNAGPYYTQIGSELNDNVDKYSEVFTTQLTNDDLKAIADLYSKQVSREQQSEISKEAAYKRVMKALSDNGFKFDSNFEQSEQLRKELMKEEYMELRGILKDFIVRDLDELAMQYDDGMNM